MSQEKQTKAVRAENRRIILRIVQSAKPIRWWLALGCITGYTIPKFSPAVKSACGLPPAS